MRSARAQAFALLCSFSMGSFAACTCSSDDDLPAVAPAPTPRATTTLRTVLPDPESVMVGHARELESLDLSTIEGLDLALSPIDQVGRLAEDDAATACESLDLMRVAESAPRLRALRISGCQSALHTGLGAFGASLRSLELADITLDAVTIGRIAQLDELESLTLSRVTATEDALRPLASLKLRRLVLRELQKDSPLAELVETWPRTLEQVVLEGSWAGHQAALYFPDATALRSIELRETRLGNFSLNQVKPLEHLEELILDGNTFNDTSPLYVRDLPIRRFVCDCPRLGDVGLRALRRSEGLEVVELRETQITGAGLQSLEELRDLHTLVIEDRDIGPEGYEALVELPRLRRLELTGVLEHPTMPQLGLLTQVQSLRLGYSTLDDRAAEELGKLVGLQELDLGHTRISDNGLVALAGMHELEVLHLDHTQITNRGLQHLAGLSKLEELWLDHTDLVDAGVQHIAGLTALRELRLDSTLVTDTGLEALLGLTSLERLNLADTVVTNEGVARLRALPKLETIGLTGIREASR